MNPPLISVVGPRRTCNGRGRLDGGDEAWQSLDRLLGCREGAASLLGSDRCCPHPDATCLGKRERQVMASLASGVSRADIAHRLRVSRRTVDRDVRSVLDKLGAPNPTVALLVLVSAAREWRRGKTAKGGNGRPTKLR